MVNPSQFIEKNKWIITALVMGLIMTTGLVIIVPKNTGDDIIPGDIDESKWIEEINNEEIKSLIKSNYK